MTNEEYLKRAGFKRFPFPYREIGGKYFYRMVYRKGDTEIMFEQTPRSHPNYRFVQFTLNGLTIGRNGERICLE